MRVIAGAYRSRRLEAPRGMATRPTSDRLRETLFNVLGERVRGAQFWDLYAGSGAVAIEALSRGAAGCVLVEEAPPAVNAMRANLAALGIKAGVQIEAKKVLRALESLLAMSRKAGVEATGADIVFLDPPYEAATEYAATLGFLGRNAEALLRPEAIVVAEHARRIALDERYGMLTRYRVLEQGDAGLSFYHQVPPPPSS